MCHRVVHTMKYKWIAVLVNGVMLLAEDKIMTSSTDKPVVDAGQLFPLWISMISTHSLHITWLPEWWWSSVLVLIFYLRDAPTRTGQFVIDILFPKQVLFWGNPPHFFREQKLSFFSPSPTSCKNWVFFSKPNLHAQRKIGEIVRIYVPWGLVQWGLL